MTTTSSKLQQNASTSTKIAQMSNCLIYHQYQGDKMSKKCFIASHFKRNLNYSIHMANIQLVSHVTTGMH